MKAAITLPATLALLAISASLPGVAATGIESESASCSRTVTTPCHDVRNWPHPVIRHCLLGGEAYILSLVVHGRGDVDGYVGRHPYSYEA
ncbi:MAG: hypothetical protein ACLPTM_02155 [Steroidobacteraceae bacterium]